MQEGDIPRQHDFFQDVALYGLDSALPRVSPWNRAGAFHERWTKPDDWLTLHFVTWARRIALTTHAKNERAIRCYFACDLVDEGRPRKATWVEGEYVDLVEMSLLREEWQARYQPYRSGPQGRVSRSCLSVTIWRSGISS